MENFLIEAFYQLKNYWLLLSATFLLAMVVYIRVNFKPAAQLDSHVFGISKASLLHFLFGLCLSLLICSYAMVYKWGVIFQLATIVSTLLIMGYLIFKATGKLVIGQEGVLFTTILSKTFTEYSDIEKIEKTVDSFGDGSNSLQVSYRLKSGKRIAFDDFNQSTDIVRLLIEKTQIKIEKDSLSEINKISRKKSEPALPLEIIKISLLSIMIVLSVLNFAKFFKLSLSITH